MEQEHPTAPFGRRTMTLAMVASQVAARACPQDKAAHKWKVFRAITTAKEVLGVSDRALVVLNALLTCLPETAMTAGPELTVFPSNSQLALRAHGMSESTLRRQLHALVGAGLIIRRDSPNGKRYARRAGEGVVERAFGFDLTPLVVRCDEIQDLAEGVERRRRAAVLERERVSLLRRDVAKMIATGLEEGVDADWAGIQRELARLSGRLPRAASSGVLEPLAAGLHVLAVSVGKLLEQKAKSWNLSGNVEQGDVHYQNSNPDSLNELNPSSEEEGGEVEPDAPKALPPRSFSLGTVLKACPDIAMYSRGRIEDWRSFVDLAGTVRGALGISPSAWEEARRAMGDADAAVTVAAILQRAEEINSPGGYLRGLTSKARSGQFSTGPMIMALMRKQLAASAHVGRVTMG